MAVAALTATFAQFVVEVQTDVGPPIVWTKICGITTRGINRTSNMQTSEVPYCDDETLPSALERAVQSQEVTISGNGVWAAQSHEMMLDWWYSGATKIIRVQHVNAAVGDTEYETGNAYLVSLNNQGEKGQKKTAELEIQFDGIPTRTAKA
jgi:hypothetical protein